jgi:hypothetical protein
MDDPFGIVPADIKARYEQAEWVERSVTAGRALERELKSTFGPEMEVVFVKDHPDLPESCEPWRWHVRRNNAPPAVATYLPIMSEGGGYRDPDAGVIAELAEIDLRRPGVREKLMERTRTDSPHKRAEKDLRKEQRRDVMAMDYRAARRVRGEGGLKKSFAGKRGEAS